jgi:signal transduction histidine kinase
VQSGEELGKIYYELSVELQSINSDSALYYANQSELIFQKGDSKSLLPYLFKSKGKIYEIKMVTDRSLFYYNKAYEEFIKLENQHEIGECALNMANIYFEMANFSEAYFFYMQSLRAYERDGDQMGIAMMQNNLGKVAHEMDNLSDAEKHYQNAYEIYKEHGLSTDECNVLGNIGLIFYDKQAFDTALIYFQEVLDILDPDSLSSEAQQYILSNTYENTALTYSAIGAHNMALDYLRKGLDLAMEIGDQYIIGSVYTSLGSLYGEMRNKESALYYLHRALKIAKDRGYRNLELEVYDELAKMHAGMGNYASAYNWLLRYDTVYKAVFNEIQSEQMASLRARYEQEIKDQEILQLQSESQVQKMLNKVFIIFIVVIVGLVIIIAVNLRSKKRTNQMLAERNLQISNAIQKLSESENELQKLNKSKDRIFSVVAHDLRNPVAAVTGFSELLYDNFEQFSVETQKEYLLQVLQGTQRIQNLLENLLIWARAQMKAVKYEPETIKVKALVDECIKEMKANLDSKKVVCIAKVDRKCVIYADRAMIHTVVRNLIMNAIKFSFPGGKIRINSNMMDGQCSLSISDDGIGIQPEIQEKLFNANEVVTTPGTTGESGSGLGLVICKEFLDRNEGSIQVESEPGNGASFIVSLPAT